MRPITFEERQDLILRCSCDVLDFVCWLQCLERKYKVPHRQILAVLERPSRKTNLSKEYLQVIRNSLANEGRELTPKQLRKVVEKILAKIRGVMLDTGMQIPEDDLQLLRLIQK